MSKDVETPKTGRKPVNESLLIGLALFIVTLALYWPATRYPFLFFDDDRYVTENSWVQAGFCWDTIRWIFTSLAAEFWHPLTWISYLIDHAIYGMFAGGYHLTNILLHAANTVLLFGWLKRVTRAVWPSALVAALFAWHPLHVESVAWIAERKDLLSTFFLLLTLLAFANYIEESKVQSPKSKAWYGLALTWFVLGLMSKPMLVTLPVLLLLLDYWPLNRGARGRGHGAGRLFLEKIPFFALALAAGVVTIVAQRAGDALKTVGEVPLDLRVPNTLVSYARYLIHTIWPANLCVYYPLPLTPQVFPAIIAALALAGITWLVLRKASACPWLAVGWLWYVVALLPVCGLLQVGKHAMADRYTYIPSIGLFMAAAWGLQELVKARPQAKIFAAGLAGICLLGCLLATRVQLGYWRNDLALFERAVNVTENNPIANSNYGVALSNAGRIPEAISQYREALRLDPDNAGVLYNLASKLAALGDWPEATRDFAESVKLHPNDEKAQNNYGLALVQEGEYTEALTHFEAAENIRPDYSKPYFNAARVFQKLGQTGAAVTNYSEAIEREPDWPEALNALAMMLAALPDANWHNPAGALKLAGHADELTHHDSAVCLDVLAVAYAASGAQTNAVATEELAITKAKAENLPDLTAKLSGHLAMLKNGKLPLPEEDQSAGLGKDIHP